jgi:hypothetical protein
VSRVLSDSYILDQLVNVMLLLVLILLTDLIDPLIPRLVLLVPLEHLSNVYGTLLHRPPIRHLSRWPLGHAGPSPAYLLDLPELLGVPLEEL